MDADKCIFLESKPCPHPSNQVTFETCKACLEAWKAEALREKSRELSRAGLSRALSSLDEALTGEDWRVEDYLKARRRLLDPLLGGEEDLEPAIRFLLVEKGWLGVKATTYPSTWKPPKELGRRLSALLKAAQDRPQGSWLGIGGLRLGVVAAQRGRTVFMVVDEGVGPEGLGAALELVSGLLAGRDWRKALGSLLPS